jgi:hypothetical protein
MAGEPGWGGDVYRAVLMEGLLELLAKLCDLLLSDVPYCGDQRAQS